MDKHISSDPTYLERMETMRESYEVEGYVDAELANPIGSRRSSGAFQTARSKRKYWIIMAMLLVTALAFTWGLIWYKNPMPVGHPAFAAIAERRMEAVFVMLIVAICQGLATVAFQTVTNNRIITPSIMGFESLYTVIHTSTVFLFGATALLATRNLEMFVGQLVVMILLTLTLYTWLLTGKRGNMHAMLLVGIVIGGGLGSVSTFMQRMLTPSEFDILSARLFGSVNNAETQYFPIAIPLVVIAAVLLVGFSKTLNVVALGRDTATNLGINHRAASIFTLVLVSVLMAVSTSLVGPMTFLGFLVATLAYQFADTYDHRFVFPMAALIGYLVLTGAYFIMNHVFRAQGVVSIIIELVGGTVFLIVILRKGRL
ncbi:Iron-uptake system permease protein FeuC [Corynebacterium faecale]|nr:iron chelate uptake ABC transporter family permease subunit [Corynebacterium faecale]WJY91562.1 Iron-uptake system permease protein FeuC [Corynebacterium faecale]